jgi:hypothetical protein
MPQCPVCGQGRVFGWHVPCGICTVPQSCLVSRPADRNAIWARTGVGYGTPVPGQSQGIRQHVPGRIRAASLLLLILPTLVQAQLRDPNASGRITVSCYTGPGGAVVIPSIINGLPVTSIGDRAFQDCTNLTNVTIPDCVASIGQDAFGGCCGLTNVTIPQGVTSIGQGAFGGCYSLTKVTIPDSVTSIGQNAFRGCYSLTNVTIPNNVSSIGDGAFEGTSLTDITIPNSVTNIGNFAFYYCSNLTSVTIGSGVSSIGREAFWRCTSLTEITIPNGVTSIGQDAFGGCTRLTRVYFKGNAPGLVDAGVFQGDNNATVCYLPETTGWGSTFGGRPTALWDPQVPHARTTDSGTITNTDYIGSAFAVQTGPPCKPAPPPKVQSNAAIQRGRITPVRNSAVVMALAGGLGASALLALSFAHNQTASRAKQRKLAGLKLGLPTPRRICTPGKARNAIEDKFADLPVLHQRKSQLRLERFKRCRLCGELAVMGAFCLEHGIAHRERARKKLVRKRRNNDRLSHRLESKAKAPAQRKRAKKSE